MQVLESKRRRPQPVVGPRGLTYLAIYGRTRSGRAIVVIVRRIEDLEWTIVAAREMTAKEIASHKQWEGLR